ncbi:MAG: SDR family NAD(P)-dependent oxidoreductase, partial [Desulfobacterales bacterium]|nr:SDR family NAD(P)-dependent oxidoreductase [Desulfobacterales bacterium]
MKFINLESNIKQIEEMDELLGRLLWCQLQAMGMFTEKTLVPEDIKAKTELWDFYNGWFDESIAVLIRRNYLHYDGKLFSVKDMTLIDRDAVWEEWEQKKKLWLKNPDMKAQINLVEATLNSLPEILTKKIPATDIIFPNSSMELVEGVYKNNQVADYFNEAVADTLVAYIEERLKHDPSSRIRIIEIGAGTGGTSSMVFNKLKPYQNHIEEYCYTDISKAFLIHGEKEYGAENPYLTCKIFNAEMPIAGQDISAGGYDMVIATNVLHATKNIRQTLRNVKTVLRHNGLVVLNEMCSNILFAHLTFGLLEGWWLYEDSWLRIPGSPGLFPETWKDELEKEGFRNVFYPAQRARVMGQQIIIAESDGIVRQKKPQQLKLNSSEIKTVEESIKLSGKHIQKSQNEDNHSRNAEEYVNKIITKKLSETLKVFSKNIEGDQPIADYGLDSILVVTFINELKKAFDVDLNTTVIFDYSTIDKLSDYMLKTHGKKIESHILKNNTVQNKKSTQLNVQEEEIKTSVLSINKNRLVKNIKPSINEDIMTSIAVTGISGQFPGAGDIEEFWLNLINGVDGVQELPSEYLDQKTFYSSKKQSGKTYCKWGGILKEKDCFDPLFFNISPREAESMNPHQRMILQESWRALEDAGYNPGDLAGSKTGVFIGAEPTGYMHETFTGSSEAIVASRLSYFLDLSGPALVINTGCSSSGVAIHLACESLRNNETSLALAGGVFATLDQTALITLSEIEMLSYSGRCRTFDESGDGTVFSESVGVVVLKRLNDAISDGDHIYGIIEASGTNQDGASNGITAPNGAAQERLITDVYKKYSINPEDITYAEVHGTGTRLGDPVEANSLVRAFKQFTDKNNFCAVGSSKSHIGHTAAAAGVAGLIKILLSLRHHKIPGLINFNKLNPLIEFENSAFYMNTELSEWRSYDNNPLKAVLNSFGHSGTNVHLVVQEYIPHNDNLSNQQISNEDYIVVISAKNEEGLKTYALEFNSFLKQFPETDMKELAFTLQEGREAMTHRLAVVATNTATLSEKLAGYCKGESDIENLYTGNVKKDRKNNVLVSGSAGEQFINAIVEEGNYNKIAQLWASGIKIDWNLFYLSEKPTRISLPTYPFAKERYWKSTIELENQMLNVNVFASKLHPLLHQNTSNMSEQKFSSTFTGEEFFLSDHVVKGQRMLPGIAYLEMARAAIENSTEALRDSNVRIRLENVVWGRPIAVGDEKIQVHIRLFPEDNGEIAYEIYCDSGEEDVIVYSQGNAVLCKDADATTIDIKTIQEKCNQSVLSSTQCYEAFKAIGLEYGPAQQGIEKVYVGENHALSKLTLSPLVSDTKDQYMLHPGMLDSALQSLMIFMQDSFDTENRTEVKPAFPFALQELVILKNFTSNMWAWIRYSAGSKPDDKIQKFDIDFCNDNGDVCVKLKGLSSKLLEGEVELSAIGTLMFEPKWKEQNVSMDIEAVEYTEHLVLLCDPEEALFESIEKDMKDVNLLAMSSNEKGTTERFKKYSLQIFEEIQRIIKEKPSGSVLIQVVISHGNKEKLLFGLSGLLKTAALENPKITGQIIELDNSEEIVKILQENIRTTYDMQIKYENGKRYAKNSVEVNSSKEVNIPWKDKGVYLITGGAGGLGQIFAKEILAKVKYTTLILTGRSELNKDKRTQLEKLESMGAIIDYRQIDVTNKESVINLMESLQDEFGKLDGIIHSAGVIRDNFILKKNREEFEEVLAPKVTGLVNLDEASKNIPLDFFIFFSSIAGSMGNIGQADYACGNAFMDAYSGYRNNLVSSNLRHGKTLSINWPFWKDGGMSVDKEIEKMLLPSMGMISMQTLSGINALYRGLVSVHNQLMVTEGDVQKMRERLFNTASKIYDDQTKPSAKQVDLKFLKEKIVHKIKVLFGEVTRINVSQIDIEESLESYGIDSIMITKLNKKLEEIFYGLSKTLFFEYQTLETLTGYLISDHKHECVKWTGLGGDTLNLSRKSSEKKYDVCEFPVLVPLKAGKKIDRNYTATASYGKRESIAIIGISGRFPQAKTLNEYWENLKAGKDCITEIPKERWSLDGFYHSDQKEATAQWKSYSRWGGFVEGFSEFDPLFFKMSPRESMNIDPQERLFIKSCWEVLEDGGYTRDQITKQYNNRVGVFAGITKTGFDLYGPDLWRQGEDVYPRTSFGSVANRVSYLLNLHGPSMPVDTMCSASLTAIHEACEHLHMGECEMAIAGGVNLYLHPSSYFLLCSQQMLSTDSKCKSFGLGGNGFVPGEGVGTVLLKHLLQAEKDQDNIYAVIRGSGINHGGKTNGYTVPDPAAQAELISTTIEKAGVDARTISYIEAHGTGTSLGDPIEISGLTKAFQKDTKDIQFCAIGSAKSNIGHCESAAGIAGVAKVVLQLKNQKLVPSLNSEILNPNIDFSKTPFSVQQELTEWKRPVINGNEVPRRAGISSFGAGGSNAHVVIEEYISKEISPSQITISNNSPAIIVFSAKNEERLKEQAKQLLEAIVKRDFSDTSLPDIAYTLQVGREAMEERLALSVVSIKELEEKLNGFLESRDDIEEIYRGQVKHNKDAISVFAADEELQEAIDKWIKRKKYAKLLNLWVKGLIFDWNKLYGDAKPSRISLPTYPFARERYWIPENTTSADNTNGSGIASFLHPLLQQNTSNFEEQQYSSTFTGEEFFLRDHVVKEQKVLPGVAYLEMAQEAVRHAAGILREGDTGILFKNVVWIRPIAVRDKSVQVYIGLLPEDNGEIAYKIYCNSGDDVIVYSQGNAALCKTPDTNMLDIKTIQKECNQRVLSSAQCYEVFKSIGLKYGPGHQGIEKIYVGENQALSKLTLPSSISETKDQYVLHPCMLDSALQSSIGLVIGSVNTKSKGKPTLPFALQELEILSSCTANMWAWVRYSAGSKSDNNIQKLDIDLCDENGSVCVRMKGFSSRVLEGDIGTDNLSEPTTIETSPQPFVGLGTLIPVWDSVFVERGEQFPSQIDHVLVIGGTKKNRKSIKKIYPKAQALKIRVSDSIENIVEKLNNCDVVNHIVWIAPYKPLESLADEALIEEQNCGVLLLFRTIKALLNLGYGTKALGWSVITIQAQSVHKKDVASPVHSSIHGLIGSMAKEFQNWKIRLVDLEKDCEWPLNDIFKIKTDSLGNARAYREHEWYKEQFIPINYSITDDVSSYKKDGVYVVIGGSGGIGEVWSEYMIRTYNAQIIWIGRREKDADVQAKLDKLSELGPVPFYISADATELKSLQGAYEKIRQNYSKINGIVHSAIVLSDKSLTNMEEEQFKSSLSTKVDVSVRMAQVFKKESLDFVMFFSSFQSFSKSPGQSNYAAGCTFKDAFAKQLSKEWPCAVKIMNWGYWGSVGIVASKEYQDRMAVAGIGSIEPFEAMEALEKLLTGQMDQHILMKTTEPEVIEGIGSDELITINSESDSINIQNIYNNIPEHDLQLKEIEESRMSQIEAMNELLCKLLWAQLKSIGLSVENNMVITDLKAAINLPELYDRWLDESIRALVRGNYITCNEDLYSVVDTAKVDVNAIWKDWDKKKEIWLKNNDMRAMAVLVDATIRDLPKILTCKVPATDIIFPDSSMKLVEGIYKQNLIADYFNEVLADTVVAYIQEQIKLDESCKIRILEIGAGTGGTSAVVFPKIKPHSEHIEEYCYTDLSKAFLMHAEKEYGQDNPYLIGKIFNVEKPLESQGVKVGNYDIVIATNVLHATKNIRKTLRNAKASLKNNGVILLNEMCSNNLFAHLTFGLLEGWWLYEDSSIRIPGCPVLYPDSWKYVMETEGFQNVLFPAQRAHGTGQQIIIAESDGIVRQKKLQQLKSNLVSKRKTVKESIEVTDKHIQKFQNEETQSKNADEYVNKIIRKKLSETLKVPSEDIESDQPI